MGCSFYSSAFSKNRREKKNWLLLGDPKKFRRVCMEFSEYNRLTSQRQFAPKCSFLASRPLGHYSFRISWQIPWFFYDVTPPDRPTSFWKKRRPWGRGSHPPTIHFKARVIKLHGCLTARHCHHFRRLFDLLGKGRNVSSEYLGNMQWNYLETRSPWFHQHSSGYDVQFDIKSKGYHLSDSYQTLIIDLE